MAKIRKHKVVFILNSILIAAIIGLLIMTFHKKQIVIDSSHGSRPEKLINLIKKSFPGYSNKLSTLVFIYNDLPSKSDILDIEKLQLKFKENINIRVFFNRKFKYQNQMKFPHHFASNLKIFCKQDESTIKSNFYLILKGDKISFVDFNFNFTELVYLVQKIANPNSDYKDYAVSIDDLRRIIVHRINKGNLNLLELNSGDHEKIDVLSGISKVYFIHADCSTCQLKSILSSIKLKKILDGCRSIIVFSIMANSFELTEFIKERNLDLKIYLDTNDEFNLMSVITDDKKNPIEIDIDEIKKQIKGQ